MPITIECPACKYGGQVPDKFAGMIVKCSKCETPFVVSDGPSASNHQESGDEGEVAPRSEPPPTRHLKNAVQSGRPHRPKRILTSESEDGAKTDFEIKSPSRFSNSLGIASMVLGIVGLLLALIPCIGFFGLPLSGLGLILGIVGFVIACTRKGSGIGFPVAGSAISLVAIAIGSVWLVLIGSIGAARKQAEEANQVSVPIAGKSDTPGGSSEKNSTSSEWIDASQGAAQQGEVRVSVTNVRVGKVSLKGVTGAGISNDELLQIVLNIENVSKTKLIHLKGWQADEFRIHASLRDNFDNSYGNVTFGILDKPADQVGPSDDLHPGMQRHDLLVFKPPVRGIEFLRLALDAENFGGTGQLKFQIPASLIGLQEREAAKEQERQRQANAQEAERQRQANEEERERQRLAKEKEAIEAAKLEREKEAEREREKQKRAEEAEQQRKAIAEQDAVRKKDLEGRGLPYYPSPVDEFKGKTAKEWYQLMQATQPASKNRADVGALNKEKADATAALVALREQAMPFLIDNLGQQATKDGMQQALKLINPEFVHHNDLRKIVACLDEKKAYTATRLMALEYLKKRKESKAQIKQIEDLTLDLQISDKYMAEVEDALKVMRSSDK
jgi:hypothetical protein